MDRISYFLRRLLLVIPTFLGITIVCFSICQFVPGGPVEQAIMRMRGVGGRGGGDSGAGAKVGTISDEQRKAIEAHFGFDKPVPVRYWNWLVRDCVGMKSMSYKYSNKTAWQVIRERFPVSLTFGLTSFFLTYLVCIPLGIAKALRHGKSFDLASSIIVFAGYAIPPFALGLLLRATLCGVNDFGFDWFPVSGFKSEEYDLMSTSEKIADVTRHMILPMCCYVIGNFAVLTLLMKNSLLEQITQDYIRTVLAKGGTMKRAIWRHAFRNAMVPIATGFSGVFLVIFAGAPLIESVFEIPGMGRLSLEAIFGRDYMVFMAILAFTSILGLIGRIFSDFCYVLIDPRISFDK